MTERDILSELDGVMRSAATIAGKVNAKMGVFVLVGLLASASIAWLLYSSDSSIGWNITKCVIVMLPAFVMCLIWQTLAKISGAPKQLAGLTKDEGLIANFKASGIKKPDSLRGLISTLRIIRNEESLSGVVDAVGGITLLVNPAFLFVTCISIAILLVLIIVAPLLLIF